MKKITIVLILLVPSIIVGCLYFSGFESSNGNESLPNRVTTPEAHRRVVFALKGSSPVSLQVNALPTIVFIDEIRTLSALVSNHSSETLTASVELRIENRVVDRQPTVVSALSEQALFFPFSVNEHELNAQATILLIVNEAVVAESSFQLYDALSDLSALSLIGRTFKSADHRICVLVARHPDDAAYRRLLPLKFIDSVRQPFTSLNLSLPYLCADDLPAGERLPHLVALSHSALPCTFLPPPNSIYETLLHYSQLPGSNERICWIIQPGLDDIAQRTPISDFQRTLDALLSRLEHSFPRARIILASPPPLPGEENFSSKYSQVIARSASRFHLYFVDIHTLTLANPGWRSWYGIPTEERAAVEFRDPNRTGRDIVAHWLVEALP